MPFYSYVKRLVKTIFTFNCIYLCSHLEINIIHQQMIMRYINTAEIGTEVGGGKLIIVFMKCGFIFSKVHKCCNYNAIMNLNTQ